MPKFRVTVEEIVEHDSDTVTQSVERLRVTVDAPGALDLPGVLAAIQKTKRVYAPRKAKGAQA